MMHKAWQSK